MPWAMRVPWLTTWLTAREWTATVLGAFEVPVPDLVAGDNLLTPGTASSTRAASGFLPRSARAGYAESAILLGLSFERLPKPCWHGACDRPARNRSCGLVAGATTTVRCGGRAVLTIDERVAFVEGRLVEQSAVFADIRAALGSLEHRMDRRFEQVDARFLQVEARLDRLGEDQSKNFRWLVGIQITTLIAVVGTLLGALAAR